MDHRFRQKENMGLNKYLSNNQIKNTTNQRKLQLNS